MHKNIVAFVLSTVSSTCMYGAQMASHESYRGYFKRIMTLSALYEDGHTSRVNSTAAWLDEETVVTGFNKVVVLWDLQQQLTQELRHHKGSVTSVACSPNENYFASSSRDTTVRLWDPQQQLTKELGHEGPVTSVAWGSNELIASTSERCGPWIWNRRGEYIRELPLPLATVALFAITFSPDGKQLSSGSSTPHFWIWDCETGEPIYKLEGHKKKVTSVKWSPNGNHIVSGSKDGTVRIWDCRGSKDVHLLQGHADGVNSVACSPDGNHIASGSKDGTVIIWDRSMTRRPLEVVNGQNSIRSVSWSPGGTRIAIASDDSTIKIWEKRLVENRGLCRWLSCIGCFRCST